MLVTALFNNMPILKSCNDHFHNFCYLNHICRDNWRSIGERRPENYLTAEFEERISCEGIQYKLQIQLHEIQPGDSHLILHAARAWDQDTHPWLDLADVKLTSLLPGDVVRDTHTSLTNAPPSISLPPAKTIYDYSSLAYLGTKVSIVSSELSVPKSPVKEDISIYCISVTTGNRKGAGTDANVTLTITGKGHNYYDYNKARVVQWPEQLASSPVSPS